MVASSANETASGHDRRAGVRTCVCVCVCIHVRVSLSQKSRPNKSHKAAVLSKSHIYEYHSIGDRTSDQSTTRNGLKFATSTSSFSLRRPFGLSACPPPLPPQPSQAIAQTPRISPGLAVYGVKCVVVVRALPCFALHASPRCRCTASTFPMCMFGRFVRTNDDDYKDESSRTSRVYRWQTQTYARKG